MTTTESTQPVSDVRMSIFWFGANSVLWGVVGGCSLAAWDALRWLKTGEWDPWRVLHGLLPLVAHDTPLTAWLHDPHEWIGLNKLVWMLLDLPASYAVGGLMVLLGIGLCWLSTSGDGAPR